MLATWNNNDNTSINKTKIIRKQKCAEKQLYWHFKWQTRLKLIRKIPTLQRKGNLKRETEFLLIVAQNNLIRTTYVKAKIDKKQQNCRCRLYNEETIHHIISKCSKLEEKGYKTKNDWVNEVINWKLCKKSTTTTTKKKNRISRIEGFAVPADHGAKLKESEKKDKFLDLARELKKKNDRTWKW